MTLDDYLFTNRIQTKQFALLLGYHRCYVSAVRSGYFVPGIKFIRKVEECTDGKVTLKDWPQKFVEDNLDKE